jgi:purine-binding chemotaxis protein CheW
MTVSIPSAPIPTIRRVCMFVVADRTFAVDAGAVQEVFRGTVTTPVPRGPAAIRGLLNLRGRIVPAVDMRRRLGFDPAAGEGIHVVLSAGGETYSLIVDSMADFVDIPVAAIEKPTGGVEGGQRECIDGVYAAHGGLVHLLSIEAILAGLGDTAAERKVR